MTAEPQTTRHESVNGVLSVDLPAPWQVTLTDLPHVEFFASMPPVEGAFTPNVTIMVYPFTESLEEFVARLYQGITQDLRQGRVVDVDDWAYREVEPDESGQQEVDVDGLPLVSHAGRIIDYTHETESGVTVASTDVVFVDRGWAVQITGTTTVPNRLIFDDALDQIARSVALLRGPVEDDSVPLRPRADMPGQDAVAEARLGGSRERLFELLAGGASIGVGAWMTGAAIERVGSLQDQVLGRLSLGGGGGGGGGDATLRELEELGLLEGGRLTDLGDVMARALNEAEVRLRITGRFGSEETLFQAFVVEGVALVAAERGYAQQVLGQPWFEDDLHRFNVQLLPLGQLTSTMLRWAGIGPAWNVEALPGLIKPELFDERLAGEAPLPEGADEALREVWQFPWFVWNFEAERDEAGTDGLMCVNAGSRGHYRVGLADHPDTGEECVAMLPVPASLLLRQLEDHLQAVLYGRQIVLN